MPRKLFRSRGNSRPILKAEVDSFLALATKAGLLDDLHIALGKGDFDAVLQMLAVNPPQPVRYDRLLSKAAWSSFRWSAVNRESGRGHPHAVSSVIRSLEQSIGLRAVAVLAAAGEGKSELAVRVTQPDGDLPGGVLLLGKTCRQARA